LLRIDAMPVMRAPAKRMGSSGHFDHSIDRDNRDYQTAVDPIIGDGPETVGAGGVPLATFANRDHDLAMATLHALPRVARDAASSTPELTTARHRLRQTIAAVDRARREAEAAAEQMHRLTDVIGEHVQLQAQLLELISRDQAARDEWIAGGRIGWDPGDAADTRALNDRIIAMQDELAAAKATLGAKEQVHRDVVSRLVAAQAERGAAIAVVAVEFCADLASRFTASLNTALTVEAMIRSVLDALFERAARGEPGMGGGTGYFDHPPGARGGGRAARC
jgi:hypothetical protein